MQKSIAFKALQSDELKQMDEDFAFITKRLANSLETTKQGLAMFGGIRSQMVIPHLLVAFVAMSWPHKGGLSSHEDGQEERKGIDTTF